MKFTTVFFLLCSVVTNAQLLVQSGLTHRLSVVPGATELVPISLKNGGDEPLLCTLTLSDVVAHCDSGYRYLPAGSTDESCAAWMQLEQEEFVLAPGGERVVKVRFAAQAGYARAGARASLLVDSRPVEEEPANQLKLRVRYAIHFHYRNPLISGVVALHAERLEWVGERDFWGLVFQNRGNVDRVVRSHAKLLDGRGKVVYSGESVSARGLMPNQCRTLRFPKPEVPEGVYQLVVVSETDAGERFGVTQEMRWEN